MGMLTKIVVVVNFVLAIGMASLTFVLWAKQVNWVQETNKAVNDYNKQKEENNALARSLETLKQESSNKINLLDSDLKAARSERDGFSRENGTLKKTVAERDASIKTKDTTLAANTELLQSNKKSIDEANKTIASLRKDADNAKQIAKKAETTAVDLAAELQAASDQSKALMAQRSTLMQRVDASEAQNRRYEGVMKEYGIAIAPAEVAGEGIPNVNGLVIKVDKELLVVDVGERKGVRKGLTLTLSRGDKYLGKAIVRDVYPDMCVVSLSEMSPSFQDIRIGDAAQTLL